MGKAPPRTIPWKVSECDVVVSYSDGEGGDAGVGVAIWSKRLTTPEAGRMRIPDDVRQLWAHQKARSTELFDIQEIEGIGPLIIITTWPQVLRNSLWVHYIDNNGALACLVKGGSSVSGTDSVVGLTWTRITSLGTLPWFDRVDTKSNPVDGLSRGDVRGPWKLVQLRFPGSSLRAALRHGKRMSPADHVVAAAGGPGNAEKQTHS